MRDRRERLIRFAGLFWNLNYKPVKVGHQSFGLDVLSDDALEAIADDLRYHFWSRRRSVRASQACYAFRCAEIAAQQRLKAA